MPDIQLESEHTLTPEQQARRRLLKLGAYVPPAILGMAIMAQTGLAQASGNNSNSNGNGGGSGTSCCPLACSPCVTTGNSNGSGGNSSGGNSSSGASSAACQRARRKMGC